MSQMLFELGLFTAKGLILVILFLFFFMTLIFFIAKLKGKNKGQLTIKNLNKKYAAVTDVLMAETLTKKDLKKYLKEKKSREKSQPEHSKNIYVLNFQGDIKASAATSLAEEVNALLQIATPKDEVVLKLESAGGVVHGYGLAAAQLMRIRDKQIPLVIAVDKVAASGGYMMASIGNKILASPFAIIGSIGVIVQLPNFHRLLKHKDIDFEQHTAGEFKRTITMFGENTQEGKEKLQEEIESIHQQFKNLITTYRPNLDINQVATGEHWLGQQALELNLIDEIKTSDDYLMTCYKNANLYELHYEVKKPLLTRLSSVSSQVREFILRLM